MLKCKLCNYSTNDSSNFQKHNKSLSHEIAVEKKDNIQKKRRVNKFKKNEELHTEIKIIRDDIKIIKKTQLETNKGVKKITDYIEFLNTHCTDVKPLTLLIEEEVDELLGLEDYNEFEFEEMIVKYVKYKKLHIKLSELIIKKYSKKTNLKKQRIWTSDMSRLIYLIFRIIGKQRNWVRDKKGELFTELITTPIINRIEKIMRNYMKHMLSKFDKNNLDNTENAKYLDNAQTAEQVLSTFYTDKVKLEMLKYMASKFSIAVKHKVILDELC